MRNEEFYNHPKVKTLVMWKVKQKKIWKILNFKQLEGNCKRARLQFCNQVIAVLKL